MAGPEIAAAALLVRDDGHVLLVQHHADDAQFGGRWSLPMHVVADQEVAEEALERLLREVLHVRPGPYEFAETVYVSGTAGARYIVNVFTCVEWDGEPRYAGREYSDAAWTRPGAAARLDVDPDVQAWLFEAFGEEAEAELAVDSADPREVLAAIDLARAELLGAFEAIPERWHARDLEEGWAPVDVLSHAASVEAYSLSESLRLLTPGHTWRSFSLDQWEADRASRGPEPADVARARLEAARARTVAWLDEATGEQLATFGNHAERGVVTVGDRIEQIARYERELVARLRRMREAAQVAAGLDETFAADTGTT